MKLVTIQTKAAYQQLLQNGFLIADSQYINKLKYGVPYQYMIEHMQDIDNKFNAEYPLWAWVKYGGFVSPPKNKLLGFFPKEDDEIVRITFEKDHSQMLVSDYIKYHFLLTNEYLPKSKKDEQMFNDLMEQKRVTKEDLLAYIRRDKYPSFRKDEGFDFINKKIQSSYQDIFNITGKYLQATVWYISLKDVKKVEIIKRESCTKKSPVDYRKMYIRNLK